ncbi:hypothetical protein AK812_SmicGene22340 [Symbiodinium microadriaticum]|uniref:Uncharacterized protein n=1 Tax=Symbiodinium microadriaticum TaxID=2951 RepID=A0A1Q9DK31_SYMMI|nr:hypothetical protein AK812_SmicGene22340 [Symbiodinium microadriaticum]
MAAPLRVQQVLEAQAFDEWLSNRRLQQDGQTYADELGRMTEARAANQIVGSLNEMYGQASSCPHIAAKSVLNVMLLEQDVGPSYKVTDKVTTIPVDTGSQPSSPSSMARLLKEVSARNLVVS